MNVEIFSLCDAATVDVSGKMNVLGAFDTITAQQLPVAYPQCAIAIRLRFTSAERGIHGITVNFIDMDGKHVVPPAQGSINVAFPDHQRYGSANLVFNMHMLKLEKADEYAFDLSVDNQKQASLPLFVSQKR